MIIDLFHRPLLDDPALFHDKNTVAELIYDVQIVRDEQIAQVEIGPQLPQQFQNLSRMVTSSALTGSSAMINLGRWIKAAAIQTRCL